MSQEGGEWVLINLDEKMARRQGFPAQVPVPKDRFESLADKGLPSADARKWCSDFLNLSEIGKNSGWRKKNRELVVSMQAFVDTGPLWDRAQKAFAEHDFEKAISTLKKIVVQHEADHSARLNLASAYANTQQYDLALKAFKPIRETYEGDAEFHVALGQLHLRMTNKEEAANEFLNALEAQPDHLGALEALAQLKVLAKIYENPRDASTLLFVRADSVGEYLSGEWDKEPRDLAFFLEQLAYHEREGRNDVVLAAADRAIKVAGEEGSERAELSRLAALRSLGKLEEAATEAAAYAEKKPHSAGAQVELARALAMSGKLDEANAAVDKALAIDAGDLAAIILKFWPDDPTDIAQMNEKLPALKEFVDAHADSPGALRSLARAYLTVNRHDDAILLLEQAVAANPEDDDLRSEWWTELARQQRWSDIIKDAEKLGDMKTRDWRLRWNEAESYQGLGRPLEARACFSAINFDETLHVDIRKRAKRAVASLIQPPSAPAAP